MKKTWKLLGGSATVALSLLAVDSRLALAVDYANIVVTDGTPSHTATPTVTIPAGQGTVAGPSSEGFFLDSTPFVGEVPIRIGASAAGDADEGILIITAANTARFPVGSTAGNGITATTSIVRDEDITSVNTRNVAGGYSFVSDRAGDNSAGSAYSTGKPMNTNVSAAYFPFSQGWKGGTLYSSTYATALDGPLDSVSGNTGAVFGVDVKPNFFFAPPYSESDPAKVGNHFIHIPGVVDSRQQGILLTQHAKNDDNFSAATPLSNGEGWQVNTRDNNQEDQTHGEIAPVSYVFVPYGTPNVTMASIWGAAGPDNQPLPILKSGANFTLVKSPDGRNGNYRLTIEGHTPESGSLFLQTGASPNGNENVGADNVLSYRPDGDGWIIVSDDLGSVNHTNGEWGQTMERSAYFDFVFLPFNAAPGAPAIQAPLFNKSTVFSFDMAVTQLTNSDDNGNVGGTNPGADMYTTLKGSTPGLNILPTRMNRGDNGFHVNGVMPTGEDGVLLTTVSQGLRNNTATGGFGDEFGVATTSLAGSPSAWEVHTFRTNASIANEEVNIDFAAAFFGRESGFQMANKVPTDASGNGHLDLVLANVNSETDGVLMLNPDGNAGRFATASPKAGGSGWDVDVKTLALAAPGTTGTPAVAAGNVNYVFLPYETENLVAGRVNADGTIVNSTGVGTAPGEFTLTRDSAGQYLLTVAGRTPSQGMLLLSAATGFDGIADNTMAYEAAGSSFRILGIDLITSDEKNQGAFTNYQDTAFSFAFIDFLTPPELPGPANFLAADFDQNGLVNGADLAAWKAGFGTGTLKSQGDADLDGDVDGNDFLVWQRQYGQLPPSTATASAVPEPTAVVLALTSGVLLLSRRRRQE